MKILVTGANGFVGSHLVPRLEKDHEVLALDKVYDVREPLDLPKMDLIINLAALNSSKESLEKPVEYFETNVVGNVNLLETARSMGAKFLYLNSVKAGELNPYGASKHCAAYYCETYRKAYNMPVILNTVGNLYGPGGDQFFVNQFVQKTLRQEQIIVFGTGEERRTILHIDDLVSLLVKQVYNFENYQMKDWTVTGGTANSLTVNELLNYLESNNTIYRPALPGQETLLVAEENVLGWAPQIDWKTGVDNLMKHYA